MNVVFLIIENEFDNFDNYNLNMLLIKRIIHRRLNKTPYLLP